MTDYSKVCWNCHQPTILTQGTFYQCRSCGATWNEIPPLTGKNYAPTEGQITTRKAHHTSSAQDERETRYQGLSGSLRETSQGRTLKAL